MDNKQHIFTSESVGAGHPDKVADQISDALVDVSLRNGDESTRTAIETLVTTNYVVIAGEIKNSCLANSEHVVEEIVRRKIQQIGYEQGGFHWANVEVVNRLHSQSGDIALGTDDFGAGDQGIMFGYACTETDSYMPAPIHYSHRILQNLDLKRKESTVLGPDCKSQVSICYEDGVPKYATNVVLSTQHTDGDIDEARELSKESIKEELGELFSPSKTKLFLNPTGNFVIGGPDGDAGLTGRKIIVDTYGGYAPHGGGAFSGKDPTKVDRSAAYMCRWLAKKAVSRGQCSWCSIQLSYAIGVEEPMSVYVDSDGDSEAIRKGILNENDLTPYGIITTFGLFDFYRYSDNCIYGHFGDKDVPWEKV